MATMRFYQPVVNQAALAIDQGGAGAVLEVGLATHFVRRDGDVVVEGFGSGFRYAANGQVIGGVLTRGVRYEQDATVATIDDANWDIGYIVSLLLQPPSQSTALALLDHLFGGADTLTGSPGADVLFGVGGDDTVDGGSGVDVAWFSGSRAQYAVARQAPVWTVGDRVGSEGIDTLRDVERIGFADIMVALDLDGHAGTVARLIGTLFGPSHVANPDFVGIGLALLDGGMGDAELAALAIGTDLFAQLAGSRANADFVNHVFANVVGRAPDAAERAEFVALLDGGIFTQASLALFAAETELAAARIDLVGLAARGLDFLPFDG